MRALAESLGIKYRLRIYQVPLDDIIFFVFSTYWYRNGDVNRLDAVVRCSANHSKPLLAMEDATPSLTPTRSYVVKDHERIDHHLVDSVG